MMCLDPSVRPGRLPCTGCVLEWRQCVTFFLPLGQPVVSLLTQGWGDLQVMRSIEILRKQPLLPPTSWTISEDGLLLFACLSDTPRVLQPLPTSEHQSLGSSSWGGKSITLESSILSSLKNLLNSRAVAPWKTKSEVQPPDFFH